MTPYPLLSPARCYHTKLSGRRASGTQQPRFASNYSLPHTKGTYANYPIATIFYYCRHYHHRRRHRDLHPGRDHCPHTHRVRQTQYHSPRFIEVNLARWMVDLYETQCGFTNMGKITTGPAKKWYGKHPALPCQFSSTYFQIVKLFLHLTMHQTTVALQRILLLPPMFR